MSPSLTRLSAAGALVLAAAVAVPTFSYGQTPPSSQSQESQPQTQPAQPAQAEPSPTPLQPQAPLQQYQIQQPGRPPLTPGTPPSTTLPAWTPPVPPAPSQTNIPAPFPGTAPPVPGAPGFVGVPGLTLPGAFAPTVTQLRGATLEFHPTARVAEEYTDNFFQTTTGSNENFRSILGPGFTLLLNGARTFGTMTTVVDLIHDTAPNSGDDVKVFPSATVTLRYALTPRVALTISDTFVRNDEPVAADAFGIRRGRQIFDSNVFSLTADWVLDRTALQAYYRNVLFSNEGGTQNQPGTGRDDTITHTLGLNASARIATAYVVRGGYEFSKTDTIGGQGGDDTTTHTGFASASRQIGLYGTAGLSTSYSFQTRESTKIWNASVFGAYGLPTGLSLSAAVGYSLLNSDSQSNEGTVSANANASYRFTRAVISVGVFQDFRQTAQQGQNFGTVVTRSYFGSFLYQLTPFINTVLHANYTENEGTGTGNDANGGTAKTLSYGATLNWQVLRWLTASLQYTYTKQTDNNFNQGNVAGTGNFAENRATLNLFATF
jgi:hypothetical protein